jgi:hypothetical protein
MTSLGSKEHRARYGSTEHLITEYLGSSVTGDGSVLQLLSNTMNPYCSLQEANCFQLDGERYLALCGVVKMWVALAVGSYSAYRGNFPM